VRRIGPAVAGSIVLLVAWLAWTALAWAPWELWQGHRAFSRGDFEAATRRFERAVRQAPRDPGAHLALGLALYHLGRYTGAADELTQASRAPDPSLKARALFALGNVRFRQQDDRAAVEAYRASLRWNEEDDDARHNLQEATNRLRRSAPPPGAAQAPPPQPRPAPPRQGLGPQEAERLLRYFDERERRHRQPAPGRPQLKPPRGTETW